MGADGTKILQTKEDDDYKYLYYFLSSVELPSDGYSRHFKHLKSVVFPLPPLAEQRRIVEILDAAQGLIDQRKEQIALMDQLVQSLFYELFGDPVSNPMGWETETLKNLGQIQTGSTPPSKLDGMFGGDIPFVTPGDLKETWVESKRTVTKEGAAKSRTVAKGATFVCCIGATIGKMGKAVELSAFNQQINTVSWGEKVEDDFGLEMLTFFKLKIANDGASTTLPILKKSLFEKIKVPVPPLELQTEFGTRVEKIEAQKASMTASLSELEDTFNALMQRAFKGELGNVE